MTKKRKRNSHRRPRYPTDLNDRRWREIEALILEPKAMGRPREVNLLRVVDGVLYLRGPGVRGGYCPSIISRRGRRSMATFAAGARLQSGRTYTTRCERGCARKRAATSPRQLPALSG